MDNRISAEQAEMLIRVLKQDRNNIMDILDYVKAENELLKAKIAELTKTTEVKP